MSIKKFSQLANDIESVNLDIDITKVENGEYEIESIIDVFLDEKEVLSESGVIGISTDLTNKPVKRGDTIYITAMIKKAGTTSFSSPAVQSVLKLRVVDIYHGLTYLNKFLK